MHVSTCAGCSGLQRVLSLAHYPFHIFSALTGVGGSSGATLYSALRRPASGIYIPSEHPASAADLPYAGERRSRPEVREEGTWNEKCVWTESAGPRSRSGCCTSAKDCCLAGSRPERDPGGMVRGSPGDQEGDRIQTRVGKQRPQRFSFTLFLRSYFWTSSGEEKAR